MAKKIPITRVDIASPTPKERAASTSDSNKMEARYISVMRGVKQGALKGMVDKMVDSLAGPISDSIVKNLSEDHPAMKVLEPAVRAALSFIVIMGVAELLLFAAPMAGKALPNISEDDAGEKGQLLARWMREYAGEKVGEEVVDAALHVFPLIMAQFSSVETDDLKLVLNELDEDEIQPDDFSIEVVQEEALPQEVEEEQQEEMKLEV